MGWKNGCSLYPLKGLLEDTLDDFFLHATHPTVTHNVGCASSIHKPEGNVEFVTVHPRPTYTKDVGMFRKRHELRLSLQELQGSQGEAVKVEDL